MIGCSQAFLALDHLIRKMAACDAPVLIEGETGTGKELAARSIHYQGLRKDMSFIPVNCGAIPDTLVESELFGHRKGAFTDAREDQLGLVAHADGGTLFLDEVEALSLKGQVVLLRFLQDQHYRPLGAKTLRSADVRIIAASNARLMELAQAGQFRMDLLFRLRILCLEMPPLRERRDDIPLLAQHFIDIACTRFKQRRKTIHPDSFAWMLKYPWPGNVRELENTICSAVLLSEGTELRLEPPRTLEDSLPPQTDSDSPADGPHFHRAKLEAIRDFEAGYLRDLMRKAKGNVSLAAHLAGKERRAMGRLLKKHGIDKDDFKLEEVGS